jgi:hypothetical protein
LIAKPLCQEERPISISSVRNPGYRRKARVLALLQAEPLSTGREARRRARAR